MKHWKLSLIYIHRLRSSRQFYNTGHSLILTSIAYRLPSFVTSDISLILSIKLQLLNWQEVLPISLLFISIAIDEAKAIDYETFKVKASLTTVTYNCQDNFIIQATA